MPSLILAWAAALAISIPPHASFRHRQDPRRDALKVSIERRIAEVNDALAGPGGGKPYVLVVLTPDIKPQTVARRLIADVSRLVYDYTLAPNARAAR